MPVFGLLDIDQCGLAYPEQEDPKFTSKMLSQKMVEFFKNLHQKEGIKHMFFITHRRYSLHPGHMQNCLRHVKNFKLIRESWDCFFTSTFIKNFLKAAGLENVPFTVSQPDDKAYGFGNGYENFVKPYEERARKELLESKGNYTFRSLAIEEELVDEFHSLTKNPQIMQILERTKEISPDSERFHYYFDDCPELSAFAMYMRIPQKTTLYAFHHNSHIPYYKSKVIPVSRMILGTLDEPEKELPHDFHEQQISRVIRKKNGIVPGQIHGFKRVVEFLRENHLMLPDQFIELNILRCFANNPYVSTFDIVIDLDTNSMTKIVAMTAEEQLKQAALRREALTEKPSVEGGLVSLSVFKPEVRAGLEEKESGCTLRASS